MRYVLLDECKPGMILAGNLYDAFGRTLIADGAELTKSFLEKLESYGFVGVYIADELSKDIIIEDVIPPQLRAEGLACVRQQNLEGCQKVAEKIVEAILSRGDVNLDLKDLRTYDDYTFAHSVNVAVYSCVMGMALDMDEYDLKNLVMAALFHDLGKMSIPLEILNKPGRLSPEEFQVMKSHATLSYELLRERWDIPAVIKEAVLSHHENVDGSGYPRGIEGHEQSLYSKILRVADVYDALISKRPYKNPYSPYEAVEYMMGACGIMFDKRVVDALLYYVPLYPKGTKVRLSDGREGIIVKNSGIYNLRPIVRLMDGNDLDLTDMNYMDITLVAEEYNAEEYVYAEKERESMVNVPYRKYRIVAVDDMLTNLQMLRTILEDQYHVSLLKSGQQIITYLQKNEYPDLILMDIDMPQMNGIEAAREINRITGGRIPILFVTALCDRETVMKCREMNAAGYIVRPYKPVFIRSEIKRILTGRSDVE